MEIISIINTDVLWEKTIEYAMNCSWKAGASLAKMMRENQFKNWERVFVVVDDTNIAGFCTFAETDCIPDVQYKPFIGFIFVDEKYRGKRLSEKMIENALGYAKSIGFEKVYIVSDHINLYEKYGFVKIDEKKDYSGRDEKIYCRVISHGLVAKQKLFYCSPKRPGISR